MSSSIGWGREKVSCALPGPQRVPLQDETARLSHIVLQKVMAKLGANYTVHGFRSSLRDWAGDETPFPREVCEGVLAHVVGGVEGAYRRSDALEKRRALLSAWADYIDSSGSAENAAPVSATVKSQGRARPVRTSLLPGLEA